MINRPPKDETANFIDINTMREISEYPVNSFVRRALGRAIEFLSIIDYKYVRRSNVEIYNLAPWEYIDDYIISEDKELNTNVELLKYLDKNFNKYISLYTDGSKITSNNTSVVSGLYDPKKKSAIT